MTISKEEALRIVNEFAEEAVTLLPNRIIAVFLVGSLATEEYVPGRSDIDTILMVSRRIRQEEKTLIKEIARKYRMKYRIPKGFGSVLLTEDDVAGRGENGDPELVPELMRLQKQGVLVWGSCDVSSVQEPTREAFLRYAKQFHSWLRENYIDIQPETMTFDAKVNTLLYEIRLYVWSKTGDYLFSKRKALHRFIEIAEFGSRTELLEMAAYLEAGSCDRSLDIGALLKDVSDYVRNAIDLDR
ncbi:nucleotidyltransferase domain-containing protein [Paenibacillus sp. GYB003]|uniref:nucleotidyltransferase domain-containing protein n=1 Tax=Paenibacillus sp. GYB003 TaxID=2994392 RepID=UPI002F96C094